MSQSLTIKEQETLRFIYGINLTFLSFCLLFAFYINVRYLPELRIRGCLVWMFYMIMYVVLVGDIISCSIEVNNINEEFVNYQDPAVDYTY